MVAAWKLDPIYCGSIKVGLPQVSLAALSDLHRLLMACESRLLSANDNTVTQEDHDGIAATARPSIGTRLEAEACSTGAAPPARPHSRRRPPSKRDGGQRQAILKAMAQLLIDASGAVMAEAGDDDE